MFDCLILGDSIATGIATERRECTSLSKVGINSNQWNQRYIHHDLNFRTVIISLGTNDHNGIQTQKELESLRNRITNARVYWILPPCNAKFCKPTIQETIKSIAQTHGDFIIENKTSYIHPNRKEYRDIAEQTR